MRASNLEIVSNQLASDDFGSPRQRSRITKLATSTALGFGILTASAILAPAPVYAVCSVAVDVVCDGPVADNTESFTFFGSVTYQNGETQGTGKGLSLDDGNVNFSIDETSSITATDNTGAAGGNALLLSTTSGSISDNTATAMGTNGKLTSTVGAGLKAVNTFANGNITIVQGALSEIMGSAAGVDLSVTTGNISFTGNGYVGSSGGHAIVAASTGGNITIVTNGQLEAPTTTGKINGIDARSFGTTGAVTVTANGPIGVAGLRIGNAGIAAATFDSANPDNVSVTTGVGGEIYAERFGIDAENYGTGTTTVVTNALINSNSTGIYAGTVAPVFQPGLVTVTANAAVSGTFFGIRAVGSGGIVIDGTGAISSASGNAIRAAAAGTGGITITQTGNITAGNNGIRLTAEDGASNVTISSKVVATAGAGVLGTSTGGNITVSVLSSGTIDPLIGVDLSTATGVLTVNNAGLIEGDNIGVRLVSTGAVPAGALTVAQTGTGAINGKAAQGVVLSSVDANLAVTGTGTTTINGGTIGVDAQSTGAGNVTVTGNVITGGTGGVLAKTSTGSITVDGTGGISTVAGTAVDMAITGAGSAGTISYTRDGAVTGEAGILANTAGSGNITIAPGADVTGTNGFAVKAVNSNVAANAGTITVTQAGGTVFSGSTDGIVTDSGLSTGLTTVTVNGTVTAGQYGIKGNSTAGDIVTNVAAASTVSGLAGVGQDTVSGAITLGNAGAISGDLAGVALHSTGAGAVGALTVAQTGTGSITSKSGPGIVSDTVDANFIVSGNGATTTITGGTFGIDLASSGNSNITITDNTITGGTGGGVLAHTVGGGITVDGTGNITTTTGKAVDLYLSGSSANTNSILYTRTGDVLGEGGIITQIKNGSGNITIAPVGNITANAGSGIGAQQLDNTAATGSVLVTTLAGKTISANGGVGIAAVNSTLGAGTVTVNNAAALKVSGIGGIVAVRNSASTGDITVNNSGAITSGTGGPGTLGYGINAVANVGANGNVIVNLTKGGDIGSASDRAKTFGVQALSIGVNNTGNVAVTLTDTSVFSVGNAINATTSGKGNVTVTGTGAGTISSSGGIGINAAVTVGGPGNVTVKVAQDVLGFTGGINAITNGNGKVSVTAHNVATTNGKGINATTTGTGAVEVLADGIILSGTGTGVNATINNAANANDLNVKLAAGSVTGTSGIIAQILAGTGSVNVTALTVTGTAGNAIDAEQQSTAVSNGAVTVTTTAGSPITATGGSGIVALNSLKGSGDVTVLSNAVINVSGGNGISATRNNGSGNIVITSNAAIAGSTAGGLGVGILGALGPNSTGNATANVNADVGTAGNPALFSGVTLTGAVGTTGSLNINVNNASVYGTNAGVTGQQNGQGNVTILGTGTGTISASTGGAVIGRIIGAGAGNVLVDVTQIAIGKTSGLLGVTGGTGNVVINSHAAVTATGGNGVVAANNNVAANAGTLTVTQDAGTLISATGGNGILTSSGLSTGLTLVNVNGTVTAPGFTGLKGSSSAGGITANLSSTSNVSGLNGVDLLTVDGPLIVNNAGLITGDNLGVQMIATGAGSITLSQTGTGSITGAAIAGINTSAATGDTNITLASGTTVTGLAGITSAVSGGDASITVNVNGATVTGTNGAGISLLGSSTCCFGTGQEIVNLTGTAQVYSNNGDGISITRNEDLGLSAVNITGSGAKIITSGVDGGLTGIRVNVIDGDGAADTGNGTVTTGAFTLVSVAGAGGNNNNGIYVSNGGTSVTVGGSSTITTGLGNIINVGGASGSGNVGLRATSLGGASTVNGGSELYLTVNGANATGILTSTGTGNNSVTLTSGTINLAGSGSGVGIKATNATGGTTTVNTGTTKITVASGIGIQTSSGSANGATSITSGGVIRTTAGAGISAAVTNAANPGAVTVLSNAAIQASGGNGIEVTNAGLGGTTVTSNALISSGGAGVGTLLSGIVINGTGAAGNSTVNLNANIGSAADVASVNGIAVTTGAGTGGVFINATGSSIWSSASGIQTNHGGAGGATILGTGAGVISSANANGVSSVGSNAGNILIDLTQTIRGKTNGINAATSGTGNITINARNTVTATAGNGISAANTNAAANAGTITITQTAGTLISATGGNGIVTNSGKSTGATTINVNGEVSAPGQTGVKSTSTAGNIALNVSATGKIAPVIAVDMATVTGAMSVTNAGILSGDTTAIKMVATGTGSGSVTNSGTITAATNTVLGTLAGGAFTINNSGTLNGGVSVSGSDVAGSTFTNTATGVWNNGANASTYSGNFVNAGLDNIAAGGSQLFLGSTNNSNRITFAGAGTFTTNGAMTNTGIINALNGVTANNQVVVGGSYVGGGQFMVDANTATVLADTMRIGGTATGNTNVVLNVLGKGFMPSGFLPIVTVTGGAAASTFTSAYPFPLSGLLLESFGQNPATNTQFGIIQRINTSVAQLGSLSTIAGSVSSFLDQPASEYVTAKTDPSAGDHQIGLWLRGGGGDDNQNLTTAVSTGGVTYSTSTRRVSTSFRNLQAGLDYGMLNMGGNGWNAHFGITGGMIDANARETGINTHLDTSFFGGYVFVSNGAFTLDATLRREWRTYKLTNPSMFGSATPVQTKGGSTAGAVSASYRVNFGNGLAFTPSAAVSFGNSSIDPFVVDSTTTFTPGSDHRSLGRAGGQLSYKSTAASGFTIEPYAGVYALRNFSNTELSSVRFSATTTTTFNTLVTAYRNAMLYNVGVKAGSATGKLSGFVEGNFRSGNGLGGGAVNMGVRLNF